MFTFTELITDEGIEEYVNDEMINSRPNPLGMIPIVHIANIPVSGSPWGLADIQDVTPLNREYNEKATDISDIINYHAAPVTVITGAKASQLEKGPKKVWGGLPKEAQVFNLELGGNLSAPLEYLALLKTAMHEMCGVPETALGQMQAISNTSGVALAIQFQPMMNRYNLKKTVYGIGLQKINELILRTLALKEPDALVFNPTYDEELQPEQLAVLDPADPISYQSEVHWPPPLPVDILVKLNEEQALMALGLQSKTGALRELGYDFPEEKKAEIFLELLQDIKDQAALDLIRGQYGQAVAMVTGIVPGQEEDSNQPGTVTSAGGMQDVNTAGGAEAPPVPLQPDPEQKQMLDELVTRAYGTKLPQRRNPDSDNE